VPALSAVVTVVEGGSALVSCLESLSAQTGSPDLEIIVPFDDAVPEVARLAERFPHVRFIDNGSITSRSSRNAFDEHALYERRRAAGLRAARGTLAALLEDRGCPRRDWAATVISLHERTPAPAIGGVVEHGGRGALRWALFFSDFGRYQPGVPEGAVEYLSDVNISYKRDALDAVRHLWEESYQESTVNWALRRAGHELRLTHAPVVVETRAQARLLPVMRERMHWARIFAHVRGREAPSRAACLAWAAVTPVLPLVLFVRHLRREIRLRRHLRDFALASPALVLLLHCWGFGEWIGYVEAAMEKRSPAAAS
jgi:hypothetical protein